jgi:aflatoxin B1 aldehyde reductase
MKLILGTMNFGPQVNELESREMVERFISEGHKELDSAYVYNNGDTENILGSFLNNLDDNKYSISTKVHPRITGKLDSEAVILQFDESLKRMNRDSVDILYFHFPDPATPIESALEKCAELYDDGKFKELGLSNFPSWKVVDIWHLCDKIGCPKPTIYQGMYNGLCRNVEPELFPALRELGIRFYAFNPLAGGLLTGKHQKFNDTPQAGRFARLKSYRNRYWKQHYFDAVQEIANICNELEIKPAEAAYRWLIHHSLLDSEKGDAIIIGASNIFQLNNNMLTVSKGSLPKTILNAFDIAWSKVILESPEYFKYFTKLEK